MKLITGSESIFFEMNIKSFAMFLNPEGYEFTLYKLIRF
jgi:hypothetical protein